VALYGKYRPKNFDDLVAQDALKTTLRHAVTGNLISHAYLFCGSRGTGKTSSARILAKAVNCTNLQSNGNPCEKCDFCLAADEGRMTDLIEIDAASNRGIDEIRDLREKIAFAPNFGRAKIYIIDEVHMLTKEAFNALLKTLEEPPSHAYFILATTEFHKVPETIRSRCQTFFFKKINKADITERLEYIAQAEGFEYEKQGLELLADRSDGGLRDAISLLEQCSSYGALTAENLVENLGILSPHILEEFFFALESADSAGALKILDALQEDGRSLEEFSKQFLGFLRKKFHLFLTEKSPRLSWVLEVIDIFSEANFTMKSSEIPPLPLEIAIAKTILLSGSVPVPSHVSAPVSAPLPSPLKTPETPAALSPAKKEVLSDDGFPPASVGVPSSDVVPLASQDIQENWGKICDQMPRSLQNILKSATVKEGDGEITVTIVSDTFRERVIQKQEELEKVCAEVLERKIVVNVSDGKTEGVSHEEFQALLQMAA